MPPRRPAAPPATPAAVRRPLQLPSLSFMLFCSGGSFAGSSSSSSSRLLILGVHCMADTSSSLLPAAANVCHSPQTPLTIHLRTDTHQNIPCKVCWLFRHIISGRDFCMTVLIHYPKQKFCQYWLFFYNFQGDPSFCWRFIESLDKTFLTENIQWEIQLSASLF